MASRYDMAGVLDKKAGCAAWKPDPCPFLPVFTEEADESTRVPGLFYSGPSLQHRGMLFCFIYKFRPRFGIIAREIARR
ncbi:hypothetical protein [Prosthecobacter sp.]